MPRCKTPSFVTEVPLIVSSQMERELTARFNAGLRLYNACLNEAETRMKLVRQSAAYQSARTLPKGKARTEAFKAARTPYRYSEYDLHSYAGLVAKRSKWIAQKLDVNTIQKLATRAFKATEGVMFGRSKTVRYKGASRFRCLEGKTNKQGIRWVDNQLVWGNLQIDSLIDAKDPVLLHGLNSPIKFVRLIRREVNGKLRYFAQLVNEGYPFVKPQNQVNPGLVGVDLNVSIVAVVGDEKAEIMPFVEKVPTYEREIKVVQRQMARSLRRSNPENYEDDSVGRKGRKQVIKQGKPKKGCKTWVKTKRYQKAAQRKRTLERRKAAYAKSQNRHLVNKVLRLGNVIKTERVSVKGWQKRWGSAIKAKSPGFFMAELVRKAESAGGQVIKFETRTTALSQTHLNGERHRKSLAERVHRDVTGFEMHRDLFSAFLSRYIVENELLLQAAQFEWPRLEPVVMEAWQSYQSANRVSASESRQSQPPVERISIVLEKINQIGDSPESARKVG